MTSSEIDAVLGGRYQLVKLLGRGGMGEVHEALDLETKRKVAVKQLRFERRMANEVAERFRREILATAQLASKHVVAILDAGVDEATGEPFMVMEYLDGEDLGAIAERLGAMPVETALRIVAQVCEGLAVAHAAGIVHRDIKPSNLFLVAPTASGARIVKIVDFGIARIATGGTGEHEVAPITELTQTGAIIGSPLYMAPEQLRGAKTLDHRADLWSLGVVAYRLLSGTLPHTGDSLGDILVTVCSTPAPPLHERAPWVPREIADLVHAALEIEPERRIASARELAAGLRAFLPDGMTLVEPMLVTHVPTGARTAPSPPSSTAPGDLAFARTHSTDASSARPAPPAPPHVIARARPPRSQPPRVRLSTVVLGVALVAAAGTALVLRHRAEPPAEDAPRPPPSPTPLLGDMPENLAHTPGAAWFARVRARCSSIELSALLADTPPPRSPDGVAFATACAALAGDLDEAQALLTSMQAGDRAYGTGPMFELAHEMADRRNDDRAVAGIMRLVLKYWPNNYQALYAAGIVEFQQGDAAAAAPHLREFVRLHPGDAFTHTAERVLAVMAAGHRDCAQPLADPMGHPIRIPGC